MHTHTHTHTHTHIHTHTHTWSTLIRVVRHRTATGGPFDVTDKFRIDLSVNNKLIGRKQVPSSLHKGRASTEVGERVFINILTHPLTPPSPSTHGHASRSAIFGDDYTICMHEHTTHTHTHTHTHTYIALSEHGQSHCQCIIVLCVKQIILLALFCKFERVSGQQTQAMNRQIQIYVLLKVCIFIHSTGTHWGERATCRPLCVNVEWSHFNSASAH